MTITLAYLILFAMGQLYAMLVTSIAWSGLTKVHGVAVSQQSETSGALIGLTILALNTVTIYIHCSDAKGCPPHFRFMQFPV